MSDRTPVQLILADCPTDQVQIVLEVIEEFSLHLEFEDDAPAENQLALGVTYMDPEVCCGSAGEISTQLQTLAPGVSFEVWEDPAYEWLGDIYRFTPTLGLFTSESDAQGTPVFTDDEVLQHVTTGHVDVSAIRLALGITHRDALIALQAKNKDIVLEAPTEDKA